MTEGISRHWTDMSRSYLMYVMVIGYLRQGTISDEVMAMGSRPDEGDVTVVHVDREVA